MQTALYLWPYMYNSIYGRFLLLQLGGVGSVLVLNILMACFGLVGRMTNRRACVSVGGGGAAMQARCCACTRPPGTSRAGV